MTPEAKRILFGNGPWVSEPDSFGEFAACGLPFVLMRDRFHGHLHAYVMLSYGHPLHSKKRTEIERLLNLANLTETFSQISFAGRTEDIEADGRHKGHLKFWPTIFRPWWVGFEPFREDDFIPRRQLDLAANISSYFGGQKCVNSLTAALEDLDHSYRGIDLMAYDAAKFAEHLESYR